VEIAFVKSVTGQSWGLDQIIALDAVAASRDPRLAWIIADLIRFISSRTLSDTLSEAAADLLGIELPGGNRWGVITDHLIAWNVPAPPD
jgi:hypothetical protein